MSTVWITGARGFIGRHLARRLAGEGRTVIGIGHGAWPQSDAMHWGVSHWINGEISGSNLQALAGAFGLPLAIFHLAGGSSVGAALANPYEDFSRTVTSTASLLEWMRLSSPDSNQCGHIRRRALGSHIRRNPRPTVLTIRLPQAHDGGAV
jgi:UDP-glucose 4-epimerase